MHTDIRIATRPWAQRSSIAVPDFSPRVLLLTSGLGQGHTRVAQAIEAALLQDGVEAETLDLWSLMNPGVASIVHHTYLRLVQEYPDLYERLYRLDQQT